MSLTVLTPIEITNLKDTATNTAQDWLDTDFLTKNRYQLLNCHDQTNKEHVIIALYPIFPEEATSALVQLFDTFMKNHYYLQNGQRILSQYWHYNDDLSSAQIEEIMENASQDQTLEQAILDYFFENNPNFDIDLSFSEFYASFIEQYPAYQLDDFHDILENWFDTNIEIDYNIDQLIRKSGQVDDLTIYFGESYDKNYEVESIWTKDNPTPEELQNTQLAWLVASQGYELMDVFDPNKRESSDFLTGLYEELFDYDTELDGVELIAIPNSTDLEMIYRLYQGKPVRLKAGTVFGLFNRVVGSGSGLGIETEKDIILNGSEFYKVTIKRHTSNGDYSPDYVYGIYREAQESDQLESPSFHKKSSQNKHKTMDDHSAEIKNTVEQLPIHLIDYMMQEARSKYKQKVTNQTELIQFIKDTLSDQTTLEFHQDSKDGPVFHALFPSNPQATFTIDYTPHN